MFGEGGVGGCVGGVVGGLGWFSFVCLGIEVLCKLLLDMVIRVFF